MLALVYCPTKLPGRQAPAICTPCANADIHKFNTWCPGCKLRFYRALAGGYQGRRRRDPFSDAVGKEMGKLQQAINSEMRKLAFKNSDVDPNTESEVMPH